MRIIGITLALWLAVALPAAADPEKIQGVISDQIAAFQEDDFERAFTYASPGIQRLFGTSENFGTMVRQGYPMVHRPADVQFLELTEAQGDMWQKVLVRDASGQSHVLAYRMQEGPDGWRIAGVNLLKAPGLST